MLTKLHIEARPELVPVASFMLPTSREEARAFKDAKNREAREAEAAAEAARDRLARELDGLEKQNWRAAARSSPAPSRSTLTPGAVYAERRAPQAGRAEPAAPARMRTFGDLARQHYRSEGRAELIATSVRGGRP